ncbi:MAG: hypothetical protein MUE33_07270 [Cytophagaceae bacterium]|jgi:hypothetical protein|nr:hypothetical protein [Cytophagaceae bacterium]
MRLYTILFLIPLFGAVITSNAQVTLYSTIDYKSLSVDGMTMVKNINQSNIVFSSDDSLLYISWGDMLNGAGISIYNVVTKKVESILQMPKTSTLKTIQFKVDPTNKYTLLIRFDVTKFFYIKDWRQLKSNDLLQPSSTSFRYSVLYSKVECSYFEFENNETIVMTSDLYPTIFYRWNLTTKKVVDVKTYEDSVESCIIIAPGKLLMNFHKKVDIGYTLKHYRVYYSEKDSFSTTLETNTSFHSIQVINNQINNGRLVTDTHVFQFDTTPQLLEYDRLKTKSTSTRTPTIYPIQSDIYFYMIPWSKETKLVNGEGDAIPLPEGVLIAQVFKTFQCSNSGTYFIFANVMEDKMYLLKLR